MCRSYKKLLLTSSISPSTFDQSEFYHCFRPILLLTFFIYFKIVIAADLSITQLPNLKVVMATNLHPIFEPVSLQGRVKVWIKVDGGGIRNPAQRIGHAAAPAPTVPALPAEPGRVAEPGTLVHRVLYGVATFYNKDV